MILGEELYVLLFLVCAASLCPSYDLSVTAFSLLLLAWFIIICSGGVEAHPAVLTLASVL